MSYITRTLEPLLLRAAREFPAVVLTGPRQSGKTTLLKHVLGDVRYVSLEPPDVRGLAAADPRGFVAYYEPPVIFDEVQYAPELLPYVKERIDANRHQVGQYFLTGSQNLALVERVTESLAGRAAVLRLLPLSLRELRGEPDATFPWENDRALPPPGAPGDAWAAFLRGGYPEIASSSERDPRLWLASYVQTYLERDVRALRQVGDLTQFQVFLRALAARSAQLLSLTDLARDLGLAVNTLKAWLSVLEATYQIFVLRPYFGNLTKRLVKTPKVYFLDTGILCYLVGLREPEHAAAGPMAGAIFETAVMAELVKGLLHRGEDPALYFWRTSRGAEVDFLVSTARGLVPIEAKATGTPTLAMAAGIRELQADLGARARPGYVVNLGTERRPLGPGVEALPLPGL